MLVRKAKTGGPKFIEYPDKWYYTTQTRVGLQFKCFFDKQQDNF